MPLTSSVVNQSITNFKLYCCSKKFQMLQKIVKSLLEQLKVCIFAEIVFGVRCTLKALANEDTLLRTHCCRHKWFPVCPHKKMFLLLFKHFVSATNVSQIAQPKKHHGQQCVRNNVPSFTRALKKVNYDG